ncbi:MAG TPA: helix-turn-helix domain-containing protein [Solirubrobacteraceae bacterium]
MGSTYPWGDLPVALRDLLRPGLPGVVEDVIAAVRAEVPEYDQPLEGEFGMLISQGVTVALEQFVGLLGRDEDVPELVTSAGLGRAEHRAGRTLDALQSAYRVGARVAWRAMAQVGAAEGVESTTMYQLAEAVFAYIDRLAAASVAGFTEAEAMRAGALQARRHALLELLARPISHDRAEINRRAEAAGLSPPPRQVAALAVRVSDPAQLARRMPSGSIGAALDPVGLVLISDPEGPGRPARVCAALRDRPAVLGPTVAWEDASVSVQRALLAWPVHAAGGLGDATLARTDDHLLTLLLAASPRLSADLRARRLGALDDMSRSARQRAIATLQAWLHAHGDVSAAAKMLHVHPQTVRYRLGGLRQAFGDGVLDDPVARLELALALQAATAFRRRSPGAGDDSSTSPGSEASGTPPPGSA